MKDEKAAILKDFRRIPGVGRSIAEDLWDLGLRRVDDLRGADPQALYDRLCQQRGMHIDRCMLYVLRCAVYFASETEHAPEKLLWWNWKEGAAAMPLTPSDLIAGGRTKRRAGGGRAGGGWAGSGN